MTKVLAFQHTGNEPLGYLEELFREWETPYEYVRLHETNELPRTTGTHLIFLGGPMSVNDEDEYPFLSQEKKLIRRSVSKKIPVLGLCLGAQLIASAFGAKVYKFVNETGWFSVSRVEGTGDVFTASPARFSVFQFHSDTFFLPYGARLLCNAETVRRQAFRYKSALALQFHPEMTEPLIAHWCRDIRKHRMEKILRETGRHLPASQSLCRHLAMRFVGRYAHWQAG